MSGTVTGQTVKKCPSSSWGTAAGVAGQILVPSFQSLLLNYSPAGPERLCGRHASFTLSSTSAAKFNTTSWNSKNIHTQQLATVVWGGNPGQLPWKSEGFNKFEWHDERLRTKTRWNTEYLHICYCFLDFYSALDKRPVQGFFILVSYLYKNIYFWQ